MTSNRVKVTELKLVEFPAGYMRKYRGDSDQHVAWVRSYTLVIRKRHASFADGDVGEGGIDLTQPFPKAALRRVLKLMLELKAKEEILDTRTNILIRRIGKSKAFEVTMPCGEAACVKEAVVKRLLKEIE